MIFQIPIDISEALQCDFERAFFLVQVIFLMIQP